jgi:serine phosphatase RsbU (regulator of sigma subunit)
MRRNYLNFAVSEEFNMQWLNKLSIQGKLSAIILTVSLILVVLISVILVANERVRLKYNMESDLLTLAAIMGHNSSIGLAFDDSQAAEDVLKSLAAKPNIVVAHVFDTGGNLFASYTREGFTANEGKTSILQCENVDANLHLDGKGLIQITEGFIFHTRHGHASAIKQIHLGERSLGGIFIQSDLEEFKQRLYWYAGTMAGISLLALLLANIIGVRLQRIITKPVYHLRDTVHEVSHEKNYSLRAEKDTQDEIGELIEGFNGMLSSIELRDQEIRQLNEQLAEENQRMGAELDVTRRLQQMVLPTEQELIDIQGLDIAAYMVPADEVGGDYYDVLMHDNGVKIGIGDVTGHGLESGVMMLMVQMAVRTLLTYGVKDPKVFLSVLNSALFGNVQRMRTDKNLTLALFDYQDGQLTCTGQHEEVLIFRHNGDIERMDTIDLGFMVGLLPDIREYVSQGKVELAIGDGVVLYTDGITEAHNPDNQMYGVERLCEMIKANWHLSAEQIKEKTIEDVRLFAAGRKLMDDITMLVIKRLA